MSNYIELTDGRRLRLKDLQRMVPSCTFMSETHVEVCERLASRANLSAEVHQVYVNMLVKKSNRARQITALIELNRARQSAIRAVYSDFIGEDLSDLLGPDLILNCGPHRCSDFLELRQIFLFVVKVSAHRLFRLFRNRSLEAEDVVRAWVDTTDQLYPQLVKTATLLIYPFNASPPRQLRYLRRCWLERRNCSMMGIPYRLRDLLRLMTNWRRREAIIATAEARAFQKHACELLNVGMTRIHTTDEFETAGFLLHGKLMDAGVECINTAHGIGLYGPYVAYSRFVCFNQRQRDYYQCRGRMGRFQVNSIVEHDDKKLTDPGDAYRPTVVYLQGNWKQAGKEYEADFELRAINKLKHAAAAIGLPFVVKVHPNVTRRNMRRLEKHTDVTAVRRLEEFDVGHPIFFSLMSTAYYTYLSLGPTCIVHDDLMWPGSLCGSGVCVTHIDELEEYLRSYRHSYYWVSQQQQQLAAERQNRTPAVVAEDVKFA